MTFEIQRDEYKPFFRCPMLMLSLGVYTFATTCYGFIISVKESRGLLTVMAVLLSIAFIGQLASVFTAMMLRTDLETEIANVGNVVTDMKKYDSEDGYTKANWDSLQSSLRCCGGKDYEVGFRSWDVVQVNGQTGRNVPDSCCHVYSEGCGRDKVIILLHYINRKGSPKLRFFPNQLDRQPQKGKNIFILHFRLLVICDF